MWLRYRKPRSSGALHFLIVLILGLTAKLNLLYCSGVRFLLKRSVLGLVLFVGLIAATLGLFRITPMLLLQPDTEQCAQH